MYKKRIKDWAIDKNLKSEKPPGSPRRKQQRAAAQGESQSSVSSATIDTQRLRNHASSSPSHLAQGFPYGAPSSAEEATQSEYHAAATAVPLQQPSYSQPWTTAGRSHGDASFTHFSAHFGQSDEQARTSVSLSSIRERFLEASDAITRRDTAVLFEILNPAYEAISNVAETEPTQLLTVVVDLFQLLHRRPNHQDILKQLLHYVLALLPDAVRQNQFLSSNSQVLNLLGRRGYASPSRIPLDAEDRAGSRPTATSRENSYDYYAQPTGTGPASNNSF